MIEEFAVPQWVHLMARMTGRHLRRSTGWPRRRAVDETIVDEAIAGGPADDDPLTNPAVAGLPNAAVPQVVTRPPADLPPVLPPGGPALPASPFLLSESGATSAGGATGGVAEPGEGRLTERFLEAARAMEGRARGLIGASVPGGGPTAGAMNIPSGGAVEPASAEPTASVGVGTVEPTPAVEVTVATNETVGARVGPVAKGGSDVGAITVDVSSATVAATAAFEAARVDAAVAPPPPMHDADVDNAAPPDEVATPAVADRGEEDAGPDTPDTPSPKPSIPSTLSPLDDPAPEAADREPVVAGTAVADHPAAAPADVPAEVPADALPDAPAIAAPKASAALPEAVAEDVPAVPDLPVQDAPAGGEQAARTTADRDPTVPAPAPQSPPEQVPPEPARAAAAAARSAAASVLAPAVRDEYNRTNLDYRRPMPRPKVRGRVVDFHCHLFARRHAEDWFAAADHYGLDVFLTMSPLEEVVGLIRDWGHRLRFIAMPQWGDASPNWADNWLRRIESFYNLGSRIAKFHASPGTMATRGHRLDAPAYEPLIAEVKARGMAIMTHIGDPDTWYHGRYADDPARFGSRDEHHRMWEGLLEAHRGTPWVGAHMGGNPEDLPRLQRLLDRFPDLLLDCSATRWMVREISARRDPAREFFIRNQDRILFGSDQVSGDDRHFDFLASRFWCHRKLWETAYAGPSPIFDPDLPRQEQPVLRGLALPDVVLQKLYHDNAARLLQRIGMSF